MDELGYKNPSLGCPSALLCPAATLWPSTAHPSQEREGIEEEGAPACYRSHQSRRRRRRRHHGRGSALHGFRSYTASNRHCIATLSPSTPTVSPSRSLPARRRTLPCRPWRSTPGARRPGPSPASGNTRTHAHTHDHAVTTPPEPRNAPACLAVVTRSPWPPGSPYRPPGNPKPRLELWMPSPCPHRSVEAFTCLNQTLAPPWRLTNELAAI